MLVTVICEMQTNTAKMCKRSEIPLVHVLSGTGLSLYARQGLESGRHGRWWFSFNSAVS